MSNSKPTHATAIQHTWLDTIHTLYRCCWARKPICAEQNDSTSPPSGRLLVEDRSSCHCYCTKDWNLALHASTSLPLVHPFSDGPSKGFLNNWKGASLSPPTTIAGQKQIKPYPMGKLDATVENKQFTNSSTKPWASRQSSVRKYWLPTLFSALIMQVFFINRRILRRIWGHVLLPLFHKWQRRSLLDVLQQEVNKTHQFFKTVVPMICYCGRVSKVVGNWNRTKNHRHNNRTTNTHSWMCCVKFNQKQMWNHRRTILVCS